MVRSMRDTLTMMSCTVYDKHMQSIRRFPLASEEEMKQYLRDDPELELMSQRLKEVEYVKVAYGANLLLSIFTPKMIRDIMTWPSSK